jgi:hypothetical protein
MMVHLQELLQRLFGAMGLPIEGKEILRHLKFLDWGPDLGSPVAGFGFWYQLQV